MSSPDPGPVKAPVPASAPVQNHDGLDDEYVVRARRPAKQQFSAMVLQLEAFLVLFAALVAFGLRVAEPATVWTVGGVLAVVLLVLSGLVRRPGGYLAGTVVQLMVIGFGVLVPMMYVLGGLFAVLWVVALRLGAKIDRERAEFDAANPGSVPPPPARRH